MSLNTYPYNPFPASTDKLDEAHNADLHAEVDQLKEDTGELQEDVETLETDKTDTAVIAPAFDAEAGVYAVGDLVMYHGKLYEFTAAHETAGDWDPTEVTEKNVADEVNSVKSGLIDVNSKLNGVKKGESAYSGTYNAKINALYTAYVSLDDAQKKNSYIEYYNKIYRYVASNTYTSGFMYNGVDSFYTQTIIIDSENSTATEIVVKNNEITITDLSSNSNSYQMKLFTYG